MSKNQETAKALEDFDNFIRVLNEGDKAEAYDLLKNINLRLVKKYYKENFSADSKEMAILNAASVIRESLEIETEYKKMRG
jgi:hypothetical protein